MLLQELEVMCLTVSAVLIKPDKKFLIMNGHWVNKEDALRQSILLCCKIYDGELDVKSIIRNEYQRLIDTYKISPTLISSVIVNDVVHYHDELMNFIQTWHIDYSAGSVEKAFDEELFEKFLYIKSDESFPKD